jgi:hypothetical protein
MSQNVLKDKQIATFMRRTFFPHIDVSDLKRPTEENRFTRSLAAFALCVRVGLTYIDAAGRVTDGSGDGGVDAFYFDRASLTLHLVQAKSSAAGEKTVAVGEIHKFFQGLANFLEDDNSSFNTKIKTRWPEVQEAIEKAERIVMTLVYNSNNELSADVDGAIEKNIRRLTAGDETIQLSKINKEQIWRKIKEYEKGPDIEAEIKLFNWGNIDEPVSAYYGQIAASDLAELYRANGQRLFAQNVREFLGSGDVNDRIAATVRKNPSNFWYFHNGITMLAKRVRKKLIGGNERASANFEVEGIEIVNGAQTVGTLGSVSGLGDNLAKTRVPIRLISLEGAPDGFAKEITVANNTQNSISPKDFASLDQIQEKMHFDLKAIEVNYLYKSSADSQPNANSVTLDDAAVALACAHADVELAVIAKSAIGRIWDPTAGNYYQRIFHQNLTALELWNSVQAMRSVEPEIRKWKAGKDHRAGQFATHLNRVILHAVIRRCLGSRPLGTFDAAEIQDSAAHLTSEICDQLYVLSERLFPGCYFASLSKNIGRCRELMQHQNAPATSVASGARIRKRIREPSG